MPLLVEKSGTKVEVAGFMMAEGKLVWGFNFTSQKMIANVRVEDISGKTAVLLVEDTAPALKEHDKIFLFHRGYFRRFRADSHPPTGGLWQASQRSTAPVSVRYSPVEEVKIVDPKMILFSRATINDALPGPLPIPPKNLGAF